MRRLLSRYTATLVGASQQASLSGAVAVAQQASLSRKCSPNAATTTTKPSLQSFSIQKNEPHATSSNKKCSMPIFPQPPRNSTSSATTPAAFFLHNNTAFSATHLLGSFRHKGGSGMYDDVFNAVPSDPQQGALKSGLKISTSLSGWPCEVSEKDCLVRQAYSPIVSNFLANLENTLVLGQPGIGKSFLGGYAVHCCLQKGYVAIYAVRDSVYVFNPHTKTATRHNMTEYFQIVREHPDAILVHDCQHTMPGPPAFKYSRALVVSTPDGDKNSWYDWDKQTGARTEILDVWTDQELEDACGVLGFDFKKDVFPRRELYGPIPRHIFSDENARKRQIEINMALNHLRAVADPVAVLRERPRDNKHPSYTLMMMVKHTPTVQNRCNFKYVPAYGELWREVSTIREVGLQRTHEAWLELMRNAPARWRRGTRWDWE